MIAAPEKDRQRAESSHLVREEIVPGAALILPVGFVAAGGQHSLHVFVRQGDPPEVAQVPVEEIALRSDFGGDRRHDEVAAVAAVPADGEGPRGWSGLRKRGKRGNDEQGERSQRPEHPSRIDGTAAGQGGFNSRLARRDWGRSWGLLFPEPVPVPEWFGQAASWSKDWPAPS